MDTLTRDDLFVRHIKKNKIESFVINSIKENILTSNLESKLRHIVEKQLEARHTGKSLSLDRIEKALATNKIQMDNIIDAISQGVKVDTVLERVKQLEAEHDRLVQEKKKIENASVSKDDVKDLARNITREVGNFEQAFDTASFLEKKNWIRQFVLGIQVEREKNRALCYIMKIPKVNHPVMNSFLPSESSMMVVAGAGLEPATFGL